MRKNNKLKWEARTLVDKALRLVKENKVKIVAETNNAYYFDVESLYDKKLVHSVIIKKYDVVNKPDASCTCKWFSLRQKECSHIKACKMMLEFMNKVKQ